MVVDTVPQPGEIGLALGSNDSSIGEEGCLLTVTDHISIQGQTDAGTPEGTYTLAVTAASGSLAHSISMSVTVGPAAKVRGPAARPRLRAL